MMRLRSARRQRSPWEVFLISPFHTLSLHIPHETWVKDICLAGLLRGPGLRSLPGNLCRVVAAQLENVAASVAQALIRRRSCVYAQPTRLSPPLVTLAIGRGTDRVIR